uniref:Cytochrome c oxidase subunit 2 n=1 Tax=Haliotis discus hannai x Haliotis iris TaxID=1899485 RepID=A0A1C9IIN0_9VEST|nr:cytochrome c oxidase subunit II [Haliotis discus hannai x Haliotis iris]AOP04387.1 cytochrome c oxidase subunit II [Haliotis discus hannai x Haliotis iris]
MAQWGQLGFQDGASPMMEQLIFFHDHALLILLLITTLVGYLTASFMVSSLTSRYILEQQTIETIWTILPAIILVFLALPSLRLLYLLDEVGMSCLLTIKATGNQWYWGYEYSDFKGMEFDSYMLPEDTLENGQYRLLEVDRRMVVPTKTDVRMLITSNDVIHSWAVPSLGVKVDAIPGRLNQTSFMASNEGVFYGQCSEICGTNHSFMPITIEAINVDNFSEWVMLTTQAD